MKLFLNEFREHFIKYFENNNISLYNLFKHEKFYAEKNNLEFKYFVFTQWIPQSQGETFSTWNAIDKEIRRRKIGTVD